MLVDLFRNNSKSTLWGGSMSESKGEIDLRKEIHELFYGSSSKPQRGHYIVYRRFDLSKFSEKYNEVYREGVGGPAFSYTDEVLICRRDQMRVSELNEASTNFGILEGGRHIYFLEYSVKPKPSDQLFEIDWDDHTKKPRIEQIPTPYSDKYNIKECFPFRSDGGRVEYWQLYCNKDRVSY